MSSRARLDHWLLEDNLADYLEPLRFERLNAVERILLGQRISKQNASLVRDARERADLIPPDIEDFNRRYDEIVAEGLKRRDEWAKVTGLDENGEPIEIEGKGFFARMLQHEVGHLDGFLYTDTLIGRNARAAKKAIKRNGWGVPGLSWIPGTVDDPFGHDDDD